jgi:predicted DNA binding CopG/RHH family protein
MTITRRPTPSVKPELTAKNSPESFIDSARHQVAVPPVQPAEIETVVESIKGGKKSKAKEKNKKEHKKRKDKEAVLIRFEDEQLTMMDQRAAALGLSRAAWLRMIVAKALMGKQN